MNLLRSITLLLCLLLPAVAQHNPTSEAAPELGKRTFPKTTESHRLSDKAGQPGFTFERAQENENQGWILVYEPTAQKTRHDAKRGQALLKATASDLDATVKQSFRNPAGTLFALIEGNQPQALAAEAQKRGQVRGKQGSYRLYPNNRYQLKSNAFPPSDPLFAKQWALKNGGNILPRGANQPDPAAHIHIEQAWQRQTGSKDVVVAVIDSGVDYRHPDLVDNMWHNPGEIADNGIDDDNNGYVDDVYGYNFPGSLFEQRPDPYDLIGHGTHVAGIIGAAGQNGVGVHGVNREVGIMALRIFDDFGFTTDFHILESVEYAVANGAKIINASFGGPVPNPALEDAIQRAGDAGILFVAAAGNESIYLGSRFEYVASYPASHEADNLLAVAATNSDDALADYSNFGEKVVQLGAPGSSVLSTNAGRVVVFREDFEQTQPGGLPAQLTASGDNNSWGVVSSGIGSPGNKALRADAQASFPYRADGGGSITLPVIDTFNLVRPPRETLHMSFEYTAKLSPGSKILIEWRDDDVWNVWSEVTHRFQGYNGEGYATMDVPMPDIGVWEQQLRLTWLPGEADQDAFGFEIGNLQIYHNHDATRPFPLPDDAYDVAYSMFNGTSMAAPQVAGVAALLLADNPNMSINELKMRLCVTGDPVPTLDGITTSGRRLNAANALNAAGDLRFEGAFKERYRIGDDYPVLWSHFNQPDQTISMVLKRNGAEIAATRTDISQSGGMVWWQVPDVVAGDGYSLELRSGNQQVTSPVFVLESFQGVTINDARLLELMRDGLDLNRDNRLSEREMLRYYGPIDLQDSAILDFSGINPLAGRVTRMILNSKTAHTLPDLGTFSGLELLLVAGCQVTEILELPDSLTYLSLDQLPLVKLGHMPAGLLTANFQNLKLQDLPDFPAEMDAFYLVNLPLTLLKELPRKVDNIELHHLPAQHIDRLPETAERLYIKDVPLLELPTLPLELEILHVKHTAVSTFPDLSGQTRLTDLWINYNPNLKKLETLPPNVERLFLRENGLTELPSLPESLRSLIASDNALTTLPAVFPDSFRQLLVDGNQLTEIPPLSADMDEIRVSRNRLRTLPDLSHIHYLFNLEAADNQLTGDLQLPQGAGLINLSGNQLTQLTRLPNWARFIDLSHNQLETLPDLTQLQDLSRLDLSHNQLTEVPALTKPYGWECINLEGNPFPESACSDLETLHALNPRGCTLSDEEWEPRFDKNVGLLAQRDENQRFLDCAANRSDEPVSQVQVTQTQFDKLTLTWNAGVSAEHTLAGYRIKRQNADGNQQTLVQTRRRRATIDLSPDMFGDQTLIVVPVDAAGNDLETLAASVELGEAMLDLPFGGLTQIPALKDIGITHTEVSMNGPGNGSFMGGTLRAYDASGELLAQQTVSPSLPAGNDRWVLEEQFSNAVIAAAARFEVESTLPGRVIVAAENDQDAFAVPVAGPASLHGAVALHPQWLEDDHVSLVLINAEDRDTQVTLNRYNRDGQPIDSQTLTVTARATLNHHLLSAAGGDSEPADLGLVTWLSETPLHAFSKHQRLQNLRKDDLFVQQAGAEGQQSGILPSYGHYLSFANPSANEVVVAYRVIDNLGRTFRRKQTVLPPWSSRIFKTGYPDMWDYNESRFVHGTYLRFEASHPVVLRQELSPLDIHGDKYSWWGCGERFSPLNGGSQGLFAKNLSWAGTTETTLMVVNSAEVAGTLTIMLNGESFWQSETFQLPIAAEGRVVLDQTTLTGLLPDADLWHLTEATIFATEGVKLLGSRVDFKPGADTMVVQPLTDGE